MSTFDQQAHKARKRHSMSPGRLDHSKSRHVPAWNPYFQQQSAQGNQALQRLLRTRATQAKLRINEPDDKHEQEADRVADKMKRMPKTTPINIEEGVIQLKPGRPLPKGPVFGAVEERTQTKGERAEAQSLNNSTKSFMASLTGEGKPLSAAERDFFEPRFGCDLSLVRISTGPMASQLARAVQARAFTVGPDVVFGSGEYAPETTAGRKLLAHELTHVVQQHCDSHTMIQRAPIYKDCEGQTDLIDAAIEQAKTLATNAAKVFNDMFPLTHQRQAIRDTFGDEVNRETIVNVYQNIAKKLDGKTYECKSSCPKTKDERESCARGEIPGSLIEICPKFEQPSCGAPELTLIHEAAHNEGKHHGEAGPADNAYHYENFAAKLRS